MKGLPDGYRVSYAQNKEDIILAAFFPDVKQGFYIDVGANHPVEDSVTKLFYDKGWSGINIEPNHSLYKMLQQNRKRDTNLNIGISNDGSKMVLREYENHGLSTASKEMMAHYESDKYTGTQEYKDRKVETRSLQSVIDEYLVPSGKIINFIKIDVEGYEYEVIDSNDWKKYRPEIVCIEANHIIKDWRPLLLSNGYTLVFNDGINDYYLRKESLFRRDYFDYSESIVLSGIVINPGVAQRIIEGEEDRYTAIESKKIIKRLEDEIIGLRQENDELKTQQSSGKYLVKAIVKRIVRIVLP